MKQKRVFCLYLSGLAGLAAFAIYFVPFVNFKVLYGEIVVERWAAVFKHGGGPGRDCLSVNYADVNDVLRSMGHKPLPDHSHGVIDLPVNCLSKMKLAEMRYDAQANAVAGIYRCEDKGMVQELQLAVFLKPNPVKYEDFCMAGSFMKSWNIPVGAATKYTY